MSESKYQALENESNESINSEIAWIHERHSKTKHQWHWTALTVILLVISLVISAGLNIIAYLPIKRSQLQYSDPKGYIISHGRNSSQTILDDYRSLYDPVWDEPRYDFKYGMMALDENTIQQYNLPEAQKWPWDRSKSIYILNGWHSIHCISVLREVLISLDKGTTLEYPFHHAVHCLHVLRNDIVCLADDTPLYTGAYNSEAGKRVTSPGMGQTRMCRDWDAIRQYAVEHTACFDAYNGGIDGPEIEKYKFCPDGSKPWEMKS